MLITSKTSVSLKILVIFLFLTGCSNKSSVAPSPTGPVINSISVSAGSYNTVVTISGTGFSSSASGDQVYFNGILASIVTANTAVITVKVPLAAGTGNIKVAVNGATATGPVFTYQTSAVVTILAGQEGVAGYQDGTGNDALFRELFGMTIDASGNLFVADGNNYVIRKVTSAGVVSKYITFNLNGYDSIFCIIEDAAGNFYEGASFHIYKTSINGITTTLAGNGISGYSDGAGVNASFKGVESMAIDNSGNLYAADTYNNMIRKITPAGNVSVFAGSLTRGYADGQGTAAQFASPTGIAIDANGNLYVADNGNSRVRKITPTGLVSTLAGNGIVKTADGPATSASFVFPIGITLDSKGNVFVTQGGTTTDNMVRMITSDGTVTTIAGGGINLNYFDNPFGIAVDASGAIYVADEYVIRKIVVE